ncbi:MAG: methyltransferase domain-containing protein [Reichenbachiella sp.]
MIDKNIHVSYSLQTKPYHKIVANLVEKYSSNDAKILDVGCGAGNLLVEINRRIGGAVISAADIDQNCLNLVAEKVPVEESFLIKDVEDLFVDNNRKSYDVIILSHVLEHVKRPYDTIVGLKSLLNSDGVLILAVPNPVRPDNIMLSFFRNYRVNLGHVQTWDQAHWRNFLENILELDVLEYPTDFIRVPFFDRFSLLHPLLILLAKIFPGFSRSCMAVVRS